eukprot:CAMPEP_0117669058 /NCGR_PEP_ID=MMETSP0804-20121206/11906_1 /TAXON_ID=1074897 /ORGANISM="Tetraselmis astigmatica, Strain CCMP880" /LENGTH=407 /DNA_ID=CAMNT_0005477043 /DNA_START=346 /DNA_END=1570 /DNA_ORIENTATION=+
MAELITSQALDLINDACTDWGGGDFSRALVGSSNRRGDEVREGHRLERPVGAVLAPAGGAPPPQHLGSPAPPAVAVVDQHLDVHRLLRPGWAPPAPARLLEGGAWLAKAGLPLAALTALLGGVDGSGRAAALAPPCQPLGGPWPPVAGGFGVAALTVAALYVHRPLSLPGAGVAPTGRAGLGALRHRRGPHRLPPAAGALQGGQVAGQLRLPRALGAPHGVLAWPPRQPEDRRVAAALTPLVLDVDSALGLARAADAPAGLLGLLTWQAKAWVCCPALAARGEELHGVPRLAGAHNTPGGLLRFGAEQPVAGVPLATLALPLLVAEVHRGARFSRALGAPPQSLTREAMRRPRLSALAFLGPHVDRSWRFVWALEAPPGVFAGFALQAEAGPRLAALAPPMGDVHGS